MRALKLAVEVLVALAEQLVVGVKLSRVVMR